MAAVVDVAEVDQWRFMLASVKIPQKMLGCLDCPFAVH